MHDQLEFFASHYQIRLVEIRTIFQGWLTSFSDFFHEVRSDWTHKK